MPKPWWATTAPGRRGCRACRSRAVPEPIRACCGLPGMPKFPWPTA